MRSILEDVTAEWLAHRITTSTDLAAEMERLLDGKKFDEGEDLPP